jgi:hypothetical protein
VGRRSALRLPDCNPDHLLLRPIRPVAKLFCDAVHVSKYSKFSALSLFMSSCALLFATYRLTQGFETTLQDVVHRIFLDQLPRKIAEAAAGWISHLITSNFSSLIFRVILLGAAYTAYELGRNAVFSIMVLVAVALTLFLAVLYFRSGLQPEEFLRMKKFLVSSDGGMWVLVGWFWLRYFHKSADHLTVFDHEVGAVLVELKR